MQAILNKYTSLPSIQNKYLYKIEGSEAGTGKASWWIIRVEPQKLALFPHTIKKGNIIFSDYGQVLDSGYGAAPDFLLKKFGFN